MSPRRGSLLVFGAATLWGTTGTAQALGPDGITPEVVALVRMLGGSLLLIYAAATRSTSPVGALPRVPLLLAIGAMASSQPLFFGGVERTGVAIGTVVTIGSGPLFAGVLAWMVRREPVSRIWFLATALSIAGAVFLVSGGESAGVDAVGLLFAAGAGMVWAVYLVWAKAVFEAADPVFAAAVIFAGAALVLSPAALIADPSWILTDRGLLVVLWLAPTTALSYVFFARGLEQTRVAVAATMTLAEPLTAGILGIAVLSEPAQLSTLIGMALIVVGLLLLARWE
jgi:DME family drug/metabolite transporter